ncbi:acyltransferase family protein [Diaphorobacter aerolatus]|uniref:acyltransferase family protein n=1 Tax=Diaphorobacter aerolatus TaxID=1288495 RepID=UPI0021F7A35E|nr:acyltransferase family protein [Diaphorobacter aerolatus]
MSSVFSCTLLALFGFRYAGLNVYSGSDVTSFLPTVVDFRLAAWEGAIGSFFLGKFSFNPVLWTIRTELFGSVLVLVLVPLVGRLPAWLRYAIYAGLIWQFSNDNLMAFVFGALAADLLLKPPRGLAGLKTGCVPALIFMLGLYLLSRPYYVPYVNLWQPVDLLMPDPTMRKPHAAGAFLLILSVGSVAPVRRLLEGRVAQFLGRLSYSLYLLHFPLLASVGALVLLAMVTHVGYGTALLLAFPVVMAICLALSMVFNRWVDEPAVAFSSRLAGALVRNRA